MNLVKFSVKSVLANQINTELTEIYAEFTDNQKIFCS